MARAISWSEIETITGGTISRTAAKNLADRLENDLRRPPAIRSEEELKLILTALRYYGHAPFGEQKLQKTGGVVTAA
jgi:hypothetical protein